MGNWGMRFLRRAKGDDRDVVIDLRERLAPYGDPDPASDARDDAVVAEVRSEGRLRRAPAAGPRHMAR